LQERSEFLILPFWEGNGCGFRLVTNYSSLDQFSLLHLLSYGKLQVSSKNRLRNCLDESRAIPSAYCAVHVQVN
jgi:hypothetical protein